MNRNFRNVSFATAASFDDILSKGALVTVRGKETRELRNRVTTLLKPSERCLFLPGRNHDVFAQVAETMWVMGGRNDVPWLSRYLDRAPQFSDDGGATWHGAYGPRLRSWSGGVDQLDEWRKLLLGDPVTRRAAGVLFDPSRDYVSTSNDIPCNNWLSWLLRDGRLHLSVAIRSNDAMWGFSGINAFEWSILQEMLAHWAGAEVGDATYFATSYHIYQDHYRRAERIAGAFYGLTPYDFGITSPRFETSWDAFPEAVSAWFSAEETLRQDPNTELPDTGATRDPLLHSMLTLVRLKWGSVVWSLERLSKELAALPENDFTTAAYERLGRQHPSLLEEVPHTQIAKFFSACRSAKASDDGDLKDAIKLLHARKNLSYAAAWKRRGERVSILPNIARKVDRLEAFLKSGSTMEGETILDTAVDLLVYAVKYVLFLAEEGEPDPSLESLQGPHPFSDFDENFNTLLDQLSAARTGSGLRALIEAVVADFEDLWRSVDSGAEILDRKQKASNLMRQAWQLVEEVVIAFPGQASDFKRTETSR